MSSTANTNAELRSAFAGHEASDIRGLLCHRLSQLRLRTGPRNSADIDLLNWLIDAQRQPLSLAMHITDEEAAELKLWIVKKLENMYVKLQIGQPRATHISTY